MPAGRRLNLNLPRRPPPLDLNAAVRYRSDRVGLHTVTKERAELATDVARMCCPKAGVGTSAPVQRPNLAARGRIGWPGAHPG
ncbi:MAG: hypothetical protein ACYDAG_12585 [Chloroflexota bacterium]